MGAKQGEMEEDWQALKERLLANAEKLREDEPLLQALGLRPDTPTNVVEFAPAALAKLEAARTREMTARQAIEAVARANFAAQAQTHALAVDLLESHNNADLARRVADAAHHRFGVVAGVIAVEGPGLTPAGWRALPSGLIDLVLGPEGLALMGPCKATGELFGETPEPIQSAALVRMVLWNPGRFAVLAFGSSDPAGFSRDMGAELVAFLARVVERTADRWPPAG